MVPSIEEVQRTIGQLDNSYQLCEHASNNFFHGDEEDNDVVEDAILDLLMPSILHLKFLNQSILDLKDLDDDFTNKYEHVYEINSSSDNVFVNLTVDELIGLHYAVVEYIEAELNRQIAYLKPMVTWFIDNCINEYGVILSQSENKSVKIPLPNMDKFEDQIYHFINKYQFKKEKGVHDSRYEKKLSCYYGTKIDMVTRCAYRENRIRSAINTLREMDTRI